MWTDTQLCLDGYWNRITKNGSQEIDREKAERYAWEWENKEAAATSQHPLKHAESKGTNSRGEGLLPKNKQGLLPSSGALTVSWEDGRSYFSLACSRMHSYLSLWVNQQFNSFFVHTTCNSFTCSFVHSKYLQLLILPIQNSTACLLNSLSLSFISHQALISSELALSQEAEYTDAWLLSRGLEETDWTQGYTQTKEIWDDEIWADFTFLLLFQEIEKCLHFNSYKNVSVAVKVVPSESQLVNYRFTFMKLFIQEIQSIFRY